MKWTCHICDDAEFTGDPQEHIRLIHPDLYEKAECWPDGSPVLYEDADNFPW